MASIEKGFTSVDLKSLPDIPGVRYEVSDGDLFVSSIGHRFTTADLKRFPEFPGVRYEIIDGELHVSRQPQWRHQYACSVISSALHAWNQETGIGFAIHAPGVIFSPDNNVAPDVVWISRARLAESEDRRGHFRSAPELVIEALSPGTCNEIRDRELKLSLYSRHGVQEYWVVDWQAQSLEVYRREPQELHLAATLSGEDVLTTPLLPGFSCPISTLWEVPTP